MQIALTGGTGYVGRFIADRLVADGHRVRVMVRRSGAPPPDKTEPHACDLSPDADFSSFLGGADALVHAAFQHVPAATGTVKATTWTDLFAPTYSARWPCSRRPGKWESSGPSFCPAARSMA